MTGLSRQAMPGRGRRPTSAVRAAIAFVALASGDVFSAAQAPGQPTFRAGIDLVELLVTVLDHTGRPVVDLRLEDFELRVDGVRQSIEFLREVRRHAARATPPGKLSPRDSADSHVSADSPLGAQDARPVVILLDDTHVSPQRTSRLRHLVSEFLERHTQPEDLISILAVSGSPAVDFTTDRARLRSHAEMLSGRNTGESGPQERAYNLRSTLATLERVALAATEMRGRRTSVLFISEGSEYNAFAELDRASGEIGRATHQAMHALRQSSVTLYAVDPRGMMQPDAETAEHNAFGKNIGNDIRDPSPRAQMSASMRGLEMLAKETGGFAVVNRNDFDVALAQVDEHAGNYYLLGFYPPSAPQPGVYRRAAVSVRRSRVRAVTRMGFAIAGPSK